MKKKILIAFDCDDTLIVDHKPNTPIVEMLKTLTSFKNVRVMVWSGKGVEYAQSCIDRFQLPRCFAASKASPDTWVSGKPMIAIDDVETFKGGSINLIVGDK